MLIFVQRFRHWNGKRKTDTDYAKDADADTRTATIMREPRRVQRFALVILFPASVGKHGLNGNSTGRWSPCFPTLAGNRMAAKGRPCASSAPPFALFASSATSLPFLRQRLLYCLNHRIPLSSLIQAFVGILLHVPERLPKAAYLKTQDLGLKIQDS